MKQFIFISVISTILIGCSNNELKETPVVASVDTNKIVKKGTQSESPDDCVFDTSTYKFTTEALLKYSPKLKYQWITSTASARALLDNGDSLTLHIGGCYNFVFIADLLTSINYSDTTALFEKTKWLAETFFYHGFEEIIPKLISQKNIKRSDEGVKAIHSLYTFSNPDTTKTNLILDGFSFLKEGDKTIINLVCHIN